MVIGPDGVVKARYPRYARGHAALSAAVTPDTANGAKIAGGKKRARVAG